MDDEPMSVRKFPEQARTCGDLLDDFPCIQCGAKGPSGCPLPPSTTIPAGEMLNRTKGLGNYLRRRVSEQRDQAWLDARDAEFDDRWNARMNP